MSLTPIDAYELSSIAVLWLAVHGWMRRASRLQKENHELQLQLLRTRAELVDVRNAYLATHDRIAVDQSTNTAPRIS